MKPLIGITCKYSYDGEFAAQAGLGLKGSQWNLLPHEYIRAVELAGGIPVLIPVYDDPAQAVDLLARIDGVVFAGGSDIGPICYGEMPGAKIGAVAPNRDAQELAMLRWLMTDGDRLPFFCICRGHQALNVAMGGTLYQDLAGEGLDNHFLMGVPMPWSSHTVELEEGSALASVTGLRKLAVNSFHHQAIKALGENLRIAARDAKGIIEAVEPVNRRGLSLSVQWHPEALAEKFPEHRSLFEAMVGAAKGDPK